MRRPLGFTYALAAVMSLAVSVPAAAYEVFATSFFSPEESDPDPGQTGVLKIDTVTGDVTTFIPESPLTGFIFPSDIVVDASANTMYVSTLAGYIFHFNATTGVPLDTLVPGPPGAFAALPPESVQNGDGYNSMLLRGSELLVSTAFGSITPYDTATGVAGADIASFLAYPSGLDQTPSGALVVSIGDPFGGPGSVVQIDEGGTTTLVDYIASPGVLGASNPTVVLPAADYNADGVVDGLDYDVWESAYGSGDSTADGNYDGVVDAADYTVWRDSVGEEARIVVADLNGNQLMGFDLDGSDGAQLAVIPPDIPDPLPPTANESAPSNSPSEVLVTQDGTLLVSTLGLTRRPDNRGALLEFDRDGTLLRTIADGLPPISGIAFVPTAVPVAVPEPAAALLTLAALACLPIRRRL